MSLGLSEQIPKIRIQVAMGVTLAILGFLAKTTPEGKNQINKAKMGVGREKGKELFN